MRADIVKKKSFYVRGFTLIELMIVVAIVGILASIAYPSYREAVAKGRRAEATAMMLQVRQFMENHYTQNNGRYDNPAVAGEPPALPASLQRTPVDGGAAAAIYAMTVVLPPAPANKPAMSYTVTATPNSSGVMGDDKCGGFSLTSLGQRSLINQPTGSTKTLADCWR
jgi:type IV pilus assembly protein PilE